MKLASQARNKGMSLPELIAVIIVIAIIGGIALSVISGMSASAKASKGAANVSELNRLVSNIKAAGGAVGAGGTAVDTTSVATALADLKTGYTPAGTSIELKLDNNFTMTEASYAVSASGVFSFSPNAEP